MRTGKQHYFVISVLIGISFLAFGSFDSAYAVDFVLSDAASCTGLPGGGETWDNSTSTCSKTANLSISTTNTLTITNGVTLAFPLDDNLINRGEITNNGIINITEGLIRNRDTGTFTNSGTIILNGTGNFDGWLINRDTSSFINFGTIMLNGDAGTSGRLFNTGSASFTNSGIITLIGSGSDSALVRNLSVLTNTGSISTNKGFNNNDPDSVLTNTGSIQITLVLDNTGGLITNTCGDITFANISGNEIDEEFCQTSFGSTSYEDPTIGKSKNGKQMVENGICIDEECWTVTAAFHQDFELVELLSDSTHTITTTVFCQHGVHKCNYVAFGVSPYGTNINDSVWKVILQKDHLDNWTMKVVDLDEYLGEVTSTTQIVNDNKHLAASATIEFKKSTPGMILNVEVRDSGGGYRDFKFNDGIAILDSYAYPSVDTSFDAPLEIEPLCLNANPDKRYTCAFEKIREQTLIDAQIVYEDVVNKKY